MDKIFVNNCIREYIADIGIAETQGCSTTFIAGALRRRDDGLGWRWIDNTGHKTIGVDVTDVTASQTDLFINWNISGSQVITLLVAPDETYSGLSGNPQIHVGASVQSGGARIRLHDGQGSIVDPNSLDEFWGNLWVFGLIAN